MSTLSPYIKEKYSGILIPQPIDHLPRRTSHRRYKTVVDMDTRRTLIWVAFFVILASMLAEVAFVQGVGNGYGSNGHHNNGDRNGGKDNGNHDSRGIDHNGRDGNGYGGGHGGYGDGHNNNGRAIDHNGHNNDNNRGGYGGHGNGHNNNGNNRGGYGGYGNGHNNNGNNRGGYGGNGDGHNNNGKDNHNHNHNHGGRGDNDEDNNNNSRGGQSGGNHSTGNGNGNQNNGNGSGKGNNGDKNGKGNGKGGNNNSTGNGSGTTDATNYLLLSPVPWTGQEQVLCEAKGACYHKTLVCPNECAQRKPKNRKNNKGCYIDCSSKCEVTCKHRRPNCNGFGSLCYDPRFVGGDGVMFYFHGAKGGDFAIVSDDKFQVNAHFIGTRPQGRTRDFTWVQALAVMFDNHTLVIAADRVPTWDDSRDALLVRWDGEVVSIPADSEAEWRPHDCGRQVVVERTDDANSVRVTVTGILEMDVKVRPIGAEENQVHNYQIPVGDAFAHLETQFRFSNLTEHVEGVLGKTYQPDYISPVKIGVPMPMMGGEDKYQAPTLYSPFCKVCRFHRQSGIAEVEGLSEY